MPTPPSRHKRRGTAPACAPFRRPTAASASECQRGDNTHRRLQVLPEHVVDGSALKVQPTAPSKAYLAWWAAHGAAAERAAVAAEDGEAAPEAQDEEALEMEAMEQARCLSCAVPPAPIATGVAVFCGRSCADVVQTGGQRLSLTCL
jgi:hypothetical protein